MRVRPVLIAGWIVAVVLGIGAQVRGAEECSASLDPAWGCGAAKVFGPVSLVIGGGLCVLWARQTRERPERSLVGLWAVATLMVLVPLIWLRAAGVT